MVLQRVATSAYSHEVLYIGSAIPLETSEGLEAVQQPLRHRYPTKDDEAIQGMMARIEIQSEGIQLRFRDEKSQVVLFPFTALNLCAAVRCVKTKDPHTKEMVPRFVSLSSPEAGGDNSDKPAIFTAITRRTKGRQVLECHGFITTHPKDALDLVRWVNTFDKRAKQNGNGHPPPEAGLSNGGMRSGVSESQVDLNFGPDDGELPGNMTAGTPTEQAAPPDFYKEPPKYGYFYTTSSAQPKKYSLQQMQQKGPETIDGGSIVNGDIGPPASDIMSSPRRYAGSTRSMPVSHHPSMMSHHPSMMRHHPQMMMGPPPPHMMGPPPPHMMGPHPQMMRMVPRPGPHPMMMRPHPMSYGHPPPVYAYTGRQMRGEPPLGMRVQPMPVMIPGPAPADHHAPKSPNRSPRRHRRSSRDSTPSDRSSSPDFPRANGKPTQNGAGSSEEDGRPQTPPTDYDQPRGPRLSRREDHYMSRSPSPTRSVPFGGPMAGPGYYMMPPAPYGVMPPYGYYPQRPGPHPHLVRARSVPPGGKENKKSKKKSKKEKKSKKKKSNKDGYEEGDDSMGYVSEFSPTGMGVQSDANGVPRDFRRKEGKTMQERAFAMSLAEENRKSTRGGGSLSAGNAYALNEGAGNGDMPLF